MISVELRPGVCRVSGHAGSAPRGEDLICAAASVLVQTLAAYVSEKEAAGRATVEVCRIRPGDAEIRWQSAYTREVEAFVEAAFWLLQMTNPENVRIEETC